MPKPSSSESIGAFGVPYAGNVRTLAPHELSGDQLYDSANVLVRDGVLRPRPGLRRAPNSQSDPSAITGVPTGMALYLDHLGQRQVLVGTTTAIYGFKDGVWRGLTQPVPPGTNAPAFAGTLTGDLDHPSRFALLKAGSSDDGSARVTVLHTNGVDPVMSWDGVQSSFVPVAGHNVIPDGPPVPAPLFTDVASVGRHFIGIVPPYDIRWGDLPGGEIPAGTTTPDRVNLYGTSLWPLLNEQNLSDTPDPLVAIQPLGTLGAAVYKEDTLWATFFQGGDESAAFRFEFRGAYTGPASPASVVNVSGIHFYLTHEGRVGSFNGSQQLWLADGVWPQVRGDINPALAHRSFGVYDAHFHEITWWYPRLTDSDGLPRGVLVLALPRPGTGRDVLGAFPGHLSSLWGGAVTAGVSVRLRDRIARVYVADAASAKTLYWLGSLDGECSSDGIPLGEGKDAGQPFDFAWQTGLIPAPGKDVFRVTALEPFLERNTPYGALQVRPVRSYALPVRGGELGDPVEIDLTQRVPRPIEGVDLRGRFVGVRYQHDPQPGDSQAPFVRYYGTLLYGIPREGVGLGARSPFQPSQ